MIWTTSSSAAAIDEHVTVAGSDQRLAGLQPVAVAGLLDFDCAFLVQAVGEGAGEDFRHMLHNHDRRAVGGHGREEDTQGLRSTCRSADGD